ncbi:efflux RND transporter periplasmic adaptor subunit [Neorhizobium lilium]|uniref:Efflux RND transporter periplasmic adaptor subunit n=1 Tax=Neorhizobium lilium TaxID=2503024 RepID=A0A3S3RKS6_9HYPH|nr:efflux RND transporter periplasmic adaptor subunit [Neorhizobium lilium]RWX78769.1 efflux RND transporter periplasmic adaptor subunit [Neorhizobium lilium]
MKFLFLILSLCGVGLLSACSDDQASATPKPRQVATVIAKVQPLVTGGSITGEVRARLQTDLSFRVGGKIVERLVDVGDHVKQGQLLARLDAEEQKAELEVAQANLNSAEAQQTQAQLAMNRQQNLFRTQVTTRAELDQAQESLLTAQGSVKSAQAQLANAQDTLSYTNMTAPADGIITARDGEVGQVAQAAEMIFTLAHDGPRDAVFDVMESLFLGRAVEPQVQVSLLSDPSRKVQASVREISPTIDSSTGTIKVKVGLPGDDPMPLSAAVSGAFQYKPQNVIQLPWSAMASKAGVPAVWVIDVSSSKVSLRAVEVGDYETGTFVIKSGLSEGEVVVSQGIKFLRQGEVVAYDKGASK